MIGSKFDPVAVATAATYHASVRAGSTIEVDISSLPAVIGNVTMAVDERFCLMGQTAPAENGLYRYTGEALAAVRCTDMDASADLVSMCGVPISEGFFAGMVWHCTTADPIVLGTTATVWAPTHPKHNEEAGAPQLTDDISKGNTAGSTWRRTGTESNWILKINTLGAAAWRLVLQWATAPVDNQLVRAHTTVGWVQGSGITVDDSGNLSLTGTADGRDLAVDGADLDAVLGGFHEPNIVSVSGAHASQINVLFNAIDENGTKVAASRPFFYWLSDSATTGAEHPTAPATDVTHSAGNVIDQAADYLWGHGSTNASGDADLRVKHTAAWQGYMYICIGGRLVVTTILDILGP